MQILFIGDIVGRMGRLAVAKILPKLKKKYKIDLVIANAENAAHGSGVTEKILKELLTSGIDAFTVGDHAFRSHKQIGVFEEFPIVRPANFPADAPGQGYIIIKKNKKKFLLISLIGQIFMNNSDDNSLHLSNIFAIIVDIHAEASSEKINMGHHLDGKISAVLGTHTHVMTADEHITKKGTAYITDVGMTGAAYESLGITKENTLKQFLTYVKEPHVLPKKGQAILNSVLIKIKQKQKAETIKPIIEFINIK